VIATTVRSQLVTLGIVSSATTAGTAWVCLVGGLSDAVAAPQVALLDTAGFPALGSHGSGRPLRPALQALVRGTAGAYAVTATKATAVFDALHYTRFADILWIAGVNNPIWLGNEPDTNRPMWSLNFTAIQE